MSKLTQQAKLHSLERLEQVRALITPPNINEQEKAQLQGVFGLDSPVYLAIRDCFYGFELDEAQKTELERLKPVIGLIRRIFLPQITKDRAFGASKDLWQDLRNLTPEIFPYLYKAEQRIIELLEKSLARLENPDLEGVSLEVPDDFSLFLGRTNYLNYVDNQIRFLMQYATQKFLTEEETKQLLTINSAK